MSLYHGRLLGITNAGSKAVITIEVGDLELLEAEETKLSNKELDIELSIHRDKRSLRANAYFWSLCSKIASKIGSSKEDVYRECIRHSILPHITSLNADGLNVLTQLLQSRSDGWFYEELDYPDSDGYTPVAIYYGSSTYNTAEMSLLIEYAVNEAKNLGIETLTPTEQARIISLWKNTT